jgi:hypothetical protein
MLASVWEVLSDDRYALGVGWQSGSSSSLVCSRWYQ